MNFGTSLKRIFKRYLLAGMAVTIPLIATIWILKFIITGIDDLVISLLPLRMQPASLFGRNIPGFGIIVTVVLLLGVGFITRLYIVNRMVALGDRIIEQIPLGRTIYKSIKQFLGTILTRSEDKFESVVLVEYPRKGCWVLGFVTGEPIRKIQDATAAHVINIFVPTTPNPTSGFLIMVPQEDAIKINISIEYAFKLIISGGIVQDHEPATP